MSANTPLQLAQRARLDVTVLIVSYNIAISRPETSDDQRRRAEQIRQVLMAAFSESPLDMEKLAHDSGVKRRTLDSYFTAGSVSPSFMLVAPVAKVLGVALDELVAELWPK